MRIVHYQPGSKNNIKIPVRGFVLLVVLLLITPLTSLEAQEPAGPAEVRAVGIEVSDNAVVIDLDLSRPAGVRTFSLTSPDRLVFDIEDALLTLDEGTVTTWTAPLSGITQLDVIQFSVEPPVVRVVAEVTDGSLQAARMSSSDQISLAVYHGENPFAGDSGPGEPPESLFPIIERFLHEQEGSDKDKFIIDFSFGIVLPQIQIESPTVLLLRFPGSDILLPASNPNNFSISVDGNITERMRAERIAVTDGLSTEIRLTVEDTSALGYTLETNSDDTLELILFYESPPVPVVVALEPEPIEGGRILVLASGENLSTPPDAPIQITRVQFQSIDAITDRFYVAYEGGEFDPNVQRFNYPTRIALYLADTSVVLPESAEGRFQAYFDGILADELKVFNRVIEDVGPECQFIFYFPGYDQENIGFDIEYVEDGLVHIDFYLTTTPVDIESPVEVNTSIDAPVPEPVEDTVTEEIEVPVPEVEEVDETPTAVEEEVSEEIEEPEIETPVPGPVEGIEEPEPVQTIEPHALPSITLALGEVTENSIDFVITTSEPMSLPELIEYHYPDRIGLRFPLAEVYLLDASPGIFTTYTHASLVPLVRAIINDRGDAQHTTLTFTLGGYLAEFDPQISIDGNTIRLSLAYSPLPEIDEPAPVEIEVELETPEPVEEIQPEPVEEVQPEPVEEVQPEPVEEVQTEPVEEVQPEEPVVDEPEVVETIEIEEPEIVTAPEPELPNIEVTLEETSDDTFVFSIITSELLPMPEWVEYRYPDRLGLRFPISNVLLMGEEDSYTTYTHVRPIPLIRTITKNRSGEQHTTVAFTLNGSIEEFNGELDWNGTEMQVTFQYNPVLAEPEPSAPLVAEAPPVPDIEEPPAIAEIEVEAAPEEQTYEAENEIVEPEIEETDEGSFDAGPSADESTEEVVEPEIEVADEEPAPEVVEETPAPEESIEPEIEIAEEEPAPEIVEEPVVEEEPVEEPVEYEVEVIAEENIEIEIPVVEPEPVEEPEPEPVVEPEPVEEPVEISIEEEPPLLAEAEIEVEPMAEIQAPAAPPAIEQEVVEIQTSQTGHDDWINEFEGVLITGFTFEKIGDADVIRFATSGNIDGWEISPMNYPTKLVARLPNVRAIGLNGDVLYYDEQVTGTLVDQFTADAAIFAEGPLTVLKVYAHGVDSTHMLAYDVQNKGNEWAIAVYPAGSRSPFDTTMLAQVEPVVVGEEEAPAAITIDEIPEQSDFVSQPETPAPVVFPETIPITPVRDLAIEDVEDIDTSDLEVVEPTIDLALEDANIRDVLQLIGEQADLNIMIDDSVRGTITISLQEIKLFELLDLLGASMNFSYFMQHGVYIFGDPSQLQEKFGTLFERWYVSLSYADPDQVRTILVSLQILASHQIQIYRGTFGSTGVIIASPLMIITGEQRDLERAYQVIAAVDQPPKMIQVEFMILNTSLTDNQNFGFNFNFGTGTGTTQLTFTEQVSQNPDMGPLPQGFDRLRAGLENTYNINWIANYLLEEGYAELVNNSVLTVANNQTGQLFVGENIPYRSTYQVSELGRVTQRIATQSVGLQLSFRPHANPDGTVTMYLTPSNSNLLELTDVGPRTVDQRFSTTVRVRDGEPFIIGGFIRDEERVKYDRFPFLSELPLLGHLFRNREVLNTKSELIFVVTPHIIYPLQHLPEIWTDDRYNVPLPMVGETLY